MEWSLKRRLLYAAIVIVSISAVTVFLLRDILFPEPTCIDGKKNGYELNIDCGGTCDKKCTEEVIPLSVVWAKSIPVSSSTYDIVGLVRNANIDNASRELGYTFTLFDENGQVSNEFKGSTTAPLDGTFPIIIQNVLLEKEPTKVSLTLLDTDHFKVKENPSSPTVSITERTYESGSPSRLYATIVNNKRIEIRNLEVRVVLYDSFDNAYAVGQTVVPFLGKEGKEQIIITWPNTLQEEPTRIRIYPIFDPFKTSVE